MAGVFIGGCSLTPDYDAPEFNLPETIGTGKDGGGTLRIAWWESFDSPELNDWIERVFEANTDLGQATSRIERARAELGLTTADRMPNLGGEAEASRNRRSDGETFAGQGNPSNSFAVLGLLSYELDLFGRLRNAQGAARKELMASEYAFYSTRNMLAAETVINWLNLQAAIRKLDFIRQTVSSREHAVELQRIRFDSGYITELALQQAEAELATAQVELPATRQDIYEFQTALLILAGAEPDQFWNRPDYVVEETVPLPELPEISLDKAPVTLLQRRPDIAAAEATLMASNQLIGVARALRWPRISLSAFYGSRTNEFENLFQTATETWRLAGAVTGPIYDFGRNRNRVRSAEAVREETEWNYRSVVIEAFGEVSDAIALQEFSAESVDAVQRQRDSFQRTKELARERYESGYTDYLDLLDAERNTFDSGIALGRISCGESDGLRAVFVR